MMPTGACARTARTARTASVAVVHPITISPYANSIARQEGRARRSTSSLVTTCIALVVLVLLFAWMLVRYCQSEAKRKRLAAEVLATRQLQARQEAEQARLRALLAVQEQHQQQQQLQLQQAREMREAEETRQQEEQLQRQEEERQRAETAAVVAEQQGGSAQQGRQQLPQQQQQQQGGGGGVASSSTSLPSRLAASGGKRKFVPALAKRFVDKVEQGGRQKAYSTYKLGNAPLPLSSAKLQRSATVTATTSAAD